MLTLAIVLGFYSLTYLIMSNSRFIHFCFMPSQSSGGIGSPFYKVIDGNFYKLNWDDSPYSMTDYELVSRKIDPTSSWHLFAMYNSIANPRKKYTLKEKLAIYFCDRNIMVVLFFALIGMPVAIWCILPVAGACYGTYGVVTNARIKCKTKPTLEE